MADIFPRIHLCILYMPQDREDVHSTEAVRNVLSNAQIHTAHGITPSPVADNFCQLLFNPD